MTYSLTLNAGNAEAVVGRVGDDGQVTLFGLPKKRMTPSGEITE